jgi:Na+/H+ antiporter NhaC
VEGRERRAIHQKSFDMSRRAKRCLIRALVCCFSVVGSGVLPISIKGISSSKRLLLLVSSLV